LLNLGHVHVARDHPDRAPQAWADAVDPYAAVGAADDAVQARPWLANLGRVAAATAAETW